MSYALKMGNLINVKRTEIGWTVSDFARACGFSEREMEKIFDGRKFLNPEQIKNIASVLEIGTQELLSGQEDNTHTIGTFSNPNNKEKILDFINKYLDLKETVENA